MNGTPAALSAVLRGLRSRVYAGATPRPTSSHLDCSDAAETGAGGALRHYSTCGSCAEGDSRGQFGNPSWASKPSWDLPRRLLSRQGALSARISTAQGMQHWAIPARGFAAMIDAAISVQQAQGQNHEERPVPPPPQMQHAQHGQHAQHTQHAQHAQHVHTLPWRNGGKPWRAPPMTARTAAAAMKAALRANDLRAAHAAFDPSLPGTRNEAAHMWDVLLETHLRAGHGDKARATIRDMQALSLPVGYVAHSCTVGAYCKARDFEAAAAYLESEVPAHLADGPTRHLVVLADRDNHHSLAVGVLESMAARGVWRSADTWVVALRLRGTQGDVEGLAADWETLQQSRLARSPKLAAAHISALGMCDKMVEALMELGKFAHVASAAAMAAAAACKKDAQIRPVGMLKHGVEIGRANAEGGGSGGVRADTQRIWWRVNAADHVKTYANIAARELALQAFRQKDISTVNSIVTIFKEVGMPVSTLVLDALLRLKASDGASSAVLENILEDALTQGTAPSEATFTVLMRSYAADGDVARTAEVMDHMRSAGISPTCMGYNALLDAYAREGNLDAVSALVDDMQSRKVHLDVCSFMALFNAVKRWQIQHRAVRRGGRSAAGELPLTHLQKELRQGVKQQLIDWVRLWDSSGLRVSPHLLTTIIQAYGQMNELEAIRALLKAQWLEPDLKLRPTLHTCNAALGACSRNAALGLALEIKADMERSGVKLDVRSYSAIIGAAALTRDLGAAQSTFEAMQEAGIDPNLWTYNAMIKAHCQSNSAATAFQVLDTLEARGLAPDNATWLTLLDSGRYLDRPDIALRVLARIPSADQDKYAAFRTWAEAATSTSFQEPLYGSDSDDNDWSW